MNLKIDTAVPLKHFFRRSSILGSALSFLWIGFLFAVYVAYSENDLRLFAVSTMLLGTGLLIYSGVGYFVWVIPCQSMSLRENGDEDGE